MRTISAASSNAVLNSSNRWKTFARRIFSSLNRLSLSKTTKLNPFKTLIQISPHPFSARTLSTKIFQHFPNRSTLTKLNKIARYPTNVQESERCIYGVTTRTAKDRFRTPSVSTRHTMSFDFKRTKKDFWKWWVNLLKKQFWKITMVRSIKMKIA